MRTYSELTTEQQQSAVNYALNTLIDPKSFEGELKEHIASLEEQAIKNAQSALYGDDPEFRNHPELGILLVSLNGEAVEPLSVTFDIGALHLATV